MGRRVQTDLHEGIGIAVFIAVAAVLAVAGKTCSVFSALIGWRAAAKSLLALAAAAIAATEMTRHSSHTPGQIIHQGHFFVGTVYAQCIY